MAWFKSIIDHLLSVYSTGPETAPGEKAAVVGDLEELTKDFRQVLQEWKMSNPNLSTAEMAQKRFREGNLFMPNSNGDLYFTNAETTYYIAFLFSASAFSGRIFREVTRDCPFVGLDELGQDAVEAACFRKIYFGHPEVFWGNFPALQIAYAKMDSDQKARLAVSMETAARQGVYSHTPIGPYIVDSFAGLPHYVEDMIERFDENADQVLDKREILDLAFPILKSTLAENAPKNANNTILKGILTYIVHYGVAPKTAAQILVWCAKLPFTKVEADRNAVYNIVALLSAPPPSPPKSGDPEPNGFVDPADLFPTVGH